MVDTLLQKIWKDDGVYAVDYAIRRELADILSDPHTHDTDILTGRYLGPVSIMPFYAEEIGLLMWTQDVLDVFDEEFGRKILGDRIVEGVNQGRYAYLLNLAAGKQEVLDLIGELTDSTITAQVGIFTSKPDPDDPATWTFNPNPTTRPSGIDILVTTLGGAVLTATELGYLITVIPRYLPYTLPDVRIQSISINTLALYPYVGYSSETETPLIG